MNITEAAQLQSVSSARIVNCHRFRLLISGFAPCNTTGEVSRIKKCAYCENFKFGGLTVHGQRTVKANFSTFLLRWVVREKK